MVEHVDALPRSEDADNLSDDFPTNTMPYVISASAGTGKTTQLLQDILLDLLNRNADEAHSSIRESLIITFTVAAAAEIRRRLEQNLQYAILYARRNHGCQPGSLGALGYGLSIRWRRQRTGAYDSARLPPCANRILRCLERSANRANQHY